MYTFGIFKSIASQIYYFPYFQYFQYFPYTWVSICVSTSNRFYFFIFWWGGTKIIKGCKGSLNNNEFPISWLGGKQRGALLSWPNDYLSNKLRFASLTTYSSPIGCVIGKLFFTLLLHLYSAISIQLSVSLGNPNAHTHISFTVIATSSSKLFKINKKLFKRKKF